MVRRKHKILYVLPRALAVMLTVFISFFALDVFGQGYGFFGTIWALIMHLIPTAILIIITKVAWKLELYGGFLFVLLGVFFTIFTWGKMDILSYLLLPGMVMLIGILFWVSRAANKKERDLIII